MAPSVGLIYASSQSTVNIYAGHTPFPVSLKAAGLSH